MKKIIIAIIILTIMLLAYTLAFAETRVSVLTGETYEILTDKPNETTVLSVPDFPSWQDCQDGKVTLNCNRQDAWRVESQQIWQDCKNGKDISAITDTLNCSQKTYEEFLDQQVKEKKEAIIKNEQDKLDAQNMVEKNKQLEARIIELEKRLGIEPPVASTGLFQQIIGWIISPFV